MCPLTFQLPHNARYLLHVGMLPDLTQQDAQTLGLFSGGAASLAGVGSRTQERGAVWP